MDTIFNKHFISIREELQYPSTVVLFCGKIYDCTYNTEIFSKAQTAVLLYITSQECLNNWQKIFLLIATLGLKDVIFDKDTPNQHYLDQGYKE